MGKRLAKKSIADRLGCRRLESDQSADGCRAYAHSGKTGERWCNGEPGHAGPATVAHALDQYQYRKETI